MPTTNFSGSYPAKGVHRSVWAGVPNGNQGLAQSSSWSGPASVQVSGTFGAAGSVTLEGSNDGIAWSPLHDTTPTAGAITLTAAGTRGVLEQPLYVRPNVTAGDGTTALTVTLIQRR